jgi:hypothetical protein
MKSWSLIWRKTGSQLQSTRFQKPIFANSRRSQNKRVYYQSVWRVSEAAPNLYGYQYGYHSWSSHLVKIKYPALLYNHGLKFILLYEQDSANGSLRKLCQIPAHKTAGSFIKHPAILGCFLNTQNQRFVWFFSQNDFFWRRQIGTRLVFQIPGTGGSQTLFFWSKCCFYKKKSNNRLEICWFVFWVGSFITPSCPWIVLLSYQNRRFFDCGPGSYLKSFKSRPNWSLYYTLFQETSWKLEKIKIREWEACWWRWSQVDHDHDSVAHSSESFVVIIRRSEIN